MRAVDGLRLAIGTFTVAPVPCPAVVDQRTAAAAMAWAPVVGLGVAAVAAAVLEGVRQLTHHSAAGVFLAAVCAVVVLAWLTRGQHLEGLAGAADRLGSGLVADAPHDVGTRRDIGFFGALTLMLVLGLQVAAVAESIGRGTGWLGVLVGVAAGRLAACWACSNRWPLARAQTASWLFAGTMRTPVLVAATLLTAAGAAALSTLDDDPGRWLAARGATAVLIGVAGGMLLARRCVRRLGAVTEDVVGAVTECATTATLLALVLL